MNAVNHVGERSATGAGASWTSWFLGSMLILVPPLLRQTFRLFDLGLGHFFDKAVEVSYRRAGFDSGQ